ncbi:MAG: nitrite reductase large subunit NirB, partial [Candidatus Nanopelagicales bacterium]|nr:nitrite reductase large subunit NirB [Candidatus Nanopelagicales bacterium]
LVLATGSTPFVPPIPGHDAVGCHTYRTLADVAAIRRDARRARTGVVIGGGLLGLEAAGALRSLGLRTTVVEAADRLLALQVDEGGGAVLARIIRRLDVEVVTGARARGLQTRRGRVRAVELEDRVVPADVVIFAVGVRPDDRLARDAGLKVAERGGIVVDERCRTSDPAIYAIGECASLGGRVFGLVSPTYRMAEIVAADLAGETAPAPEFDTSTKLKLLGVDVAGFGDAFAQSPGALEVVFSDPATDRYRKLVISDDAHTLLGGILVGAAGDYAALRARMGGPIEGDLAAIAAGLAEQDDAMPDTATVCSCRNITAGTIREAVRSGCHDIAELKRCTGVATGCGSCLPLARRLLDSELAAGGITIDPSLCEHFALTRTELFALVQTENLRTFTEIIERHGTGRGCDICKPLVASILASQGKGHVLDSDHAALQDTNDRAMANLQRDGSYSVVPRIPGGEITPGQLIVIAKVAARYDLYTKITGGQRIALFGACLDQLPHIWRELVAAGFESGHAYGKSVRTVKSCVGSTWCRFGVQDSVGMAIDLELRYRGLRSPHKVKMGVSGCARECAEARGKDIGVIATEKGWNLYVGGNGGFSPSHAELLAEDLSDAELVRTIDRVLMYYLRTGDRLQRTAAWLEELPDGVAGLARVVIDDESGAAAELDAAMGEHVAGYVDEWADALADPDKLSQFVSFVNAPETFDPDLRYQRTRDQRLPMAPVGGRP